MARVVIPGFRKIEVSGGGEGGTTNYNDLENKPSINNVPLVGNLNTANLKLTDATLTEEGVPAEAKTVGAKLEEQSSNLTGEIRRAKETEETLKSRIDTITSLPEGSTTGDAELQDIRVKADGTTATSAGNAVREQVSELKSDLVNVESQITLNGGRYEYLNDATITMNQFYTGANTIKKTDESDTWCTYGAIKIKSGTYYFINISMEHSYITIDNVTKSLGEFMNNPHDVLNVPLKLTLDKEATIYPSAYNYKQYFPLFQNGSLIHTTKNGNIYLTNSDNNRIFYTPWELGSYNFNYGNKNYFDKDNKYITSLDMEFPYDVYIINADNSKYFYYIAYNVPNEIKTNYDNARMVVIKANTKFRIGVRYLDNRVLDINSGTELIKKSLLITSYYNFYSASGIINSNLITVGSSGDYSTIQDAINSIHDSSMNNTYTILVYEGTYDITNNGIDYLPIKPYVTIKGVDKSKCIISFRPSTKDSYKNVFQQSNDFGKGYAEVCNFTLVTENIKGGLHLDDVSWKGEIYFHDIIIDDISSEEVFDSSLDYYQYMRASVGSINLATHLGQKIVIENVKTNGYIYSHSLPSNLSDMNNENAGEFIVKNCVCDWIGVYGNGEAVRKKCILENNKCHFIKIVFIDNYDLGVMCWDTILVNNHADFIGSQYFAYGDAYTMKSLTEEYYGRFPFADSNIHKQVQNNSGSDIPFGSKVKFTDYTHRYIILGTENDYDAIACESIANGWYGTVQDGGNKEAYLNYLSTHELIN